MALLSRTAFLTCLIVLLTEVIQSNAFSVRPQGRSVASGIWNHHRIPLTPRHEDSQQQQQQQSHYHGLSWQPTAMAVVVRPPLSSRTSVARRTTRPASRLYMASSGGLSYESLMEKLPSQAVLQAVEAAKDGKVIASDVAASAGVSLSTARKDLTALATLTRGDIAVDTDGELIYTFPENIQAVLSSNSAKYKALQAFQKAWPTLFWLVRVTFGVTLLVSLAAIFSTIFFLTSGSRSDDDDRRDNRGGGGGGMSFGYFWGPSPFDFFYYRPYGYYGGYYASPYDANYKDPEEMGFLESVFSYVFGDGNPNPQLDEKRLRLVSQMIRENGGAVTAEQLAPFSDELPRPPMLRNDGTTATSAYVDESFVLPIVTALNGEPQVTKDGDIVYVFPDLQMSAASSKSLPKLSEADKREARLLKRAGLKANASAREIQLLLNYNGISTAGAYEREDLIEILDRALGSEAVEEDDDDVDDVTEMLKERKYKFSLAPGINKGLAGVLGVVNLGGALYLGNLLSQVAAYGGAQLPSYFGLVQAGYPLLLGYAILFNLIPLARSFWIQRENEKIRERNQLRQGWQTAVANAVRNSDLGNKLAAARNFKSRVRQIGSNEKDIIFDTKQSMEENQQKKARSDLDEFDKKLKGGGGDSSFQ